MIANSRQRLRYAPPPVKVRRAVAVELTDPTVRRYAADVAGFIRECIIIDDAQDHGDGAGVMPFDLWPAQEALLGDMQHERLLLILKARQLGISWLACAYALHLCLFNPGRVVLAFSKGQDEANELTRRITVMYERLPEALRAALPSLSKANTEELAWSNGSRVKSMPATPSAGRTFTASLVIMDEAGFMAWAAKLYTALKPTIDGGGALIVLSTANGTANLFYDMCQRAQQGLGRFAFRFLPWHARPGRDAAWYASTEADAVDSALMKQEYPATPEEAFEATDVDTFLPSMELWKACKEELPDLTPHEPCILAVDGSESNDAFPLVIVSRHPKDPQRFAVRYCQIFTPTPGVVLDDTKIEAEIRRLVSTYAIQQLTYDRALIGQLIRRLTTQAPGGPMPISVPCEKFNQQGERLVADKGLYDLITTRRLAHSGDERLTQHVANANRTVDRDGHMRIVKRTYAAKIDACVDLAMACQRAADVLEMPSTGFAFSYDKRHK